MRKLLSTILVGLCMILHAAGQEAEQPAGVRFEAVDVFIDSGRQPLAAWQFELTARGADAKIVGLEGGEHPAFQDPPYYDPAALKEGNRIIIAAFNTGKDLPAGRTRVARVHLRVVGGEPDYIVELQAAGSADGKRIEAEATTAKGEDR